MGRRTSRAGRLSLTLPLSLTLALTAHAQEAAPPPLWATSIEITHDGAPVTLSPSDEANRRGTAKLGARLSVKRRVFGPGCPTDAWYETREGYFVCEAHARPSDQPPGGEPTPYLRRGRRLPLQYAFIQIDGTPAYAHPADFFTGEHTHAYGKGFGIVVTGRKTYEGIDFVRTRGHLWIEAEAVRRARGSSFGGFTLAPSEGLDFGWIRQKDASVHRIPKGKVIHRMGLREVVKVTSERQGDWVKLSDGAWIRRHYLALPKLMPRPDEVGPNERWIDVDVKEQVLVAYQGDKPVFATLVSTGKDRKNSRTPIGKFRLWVKLAYSDMNDTERTDLPTNYSIQDVPWVQYFEGANGFHAAFWHDRFGTRRSHGCVNLAPRDARFLFEFTEPALPPGWKAILPVEGERATLVQVR